MSRKETISETMEKLFESHNTRPSRKKKKLQQQRLLNIKQENNEPTTNAKLDFIEDVSIFSFNDIETLRTYVKLNNILPYENKTLKYKSKRKETNNEFYDSNYLKKLDDNLMANDIQEDEQFDEEEDSFNDDSKSMIWQPTIKSDLDKHKQIKKERNISITSRSIYSSSPGSLSPDYSLPECGKAHCKLGCICDAISTSINDQSSCSPTHFKSKNIFLKNDDTETMYRDHCGRFECMFECNCSRRLRSSTRQIKPNDKHKDEDDIPVGRSKRRIDKQTDTKTKIFSSNKAKLNLKFKSTKLEQQQTVTSNKTRQSKRVKLLKKKKTLTCTSKEHNPNKKSNNFNDYYFYYNHEKKLNSLKNFNKKKIKQESDCNNSETDNDQLENPNTDDTDFTVDKNKTTKTKKQTLTKKNELAKPEFEPYTQNITLKIQSKSLQPVFVSIPLRIEIYTPKWEQMQLMNKKVLRLIAKLLQKLDVLTETKKTFKEIEFEFDKELNVIVFAASHLKDCSNTDDTAKKPICVKITQYNTQNKALMSKSQLKSLISDEQSIFTTNKPVEKDHKQIDFKNIENIQKNCYVNKSLPRLICRSRNRLFNQRNQNSKPNQTSLNFKNVDCLLEKLSSKLVKPTDCFTTISSNLLKYRPDLIDLNKRQQQNDSNYLFMDEIDYLKQNKQENYSFYNPFADQSLIVDLYKTHESRDLIDSVCHTVNDMIKVISLYNENLTKKQLNEAKPQVLSLSKAAEIKKVTTENKTNYIIINPKQQQSESKDSQQQQRKIILPSMYFKTLVKIVSTNNKDEEMNGKIKISSSLIQSTNTMPTFTRSIIKTGTSSSILTPSAQKCAITQQITKILAPNKTVTTVNNNNNPPKIITMPYKATSNSITTAPKIVSITNNKSFIPIRPKSEPIVKQSTLSGLIMNDLDKPMRSELTSTKEDSQYIESRKRKRKQDLTVLVPTRAEPIKTTENNDDNIHLNILNKQINCIRNESLDSNSKLFVNNNNKVKIGTTGSVFKVSSSLFKSKKEDLIPFDRTNSNESDLIDTFHSSFSSHKATTSSSESNQSPLSMLGKKSTKILIYKENDSEEEILESDNSDYSDTESKSKSKKRRNKSSIEDSDSSFDDDFEDNFEKKIAKKLLNSSSSSNKPIVNNIHSIRERQRRFRLKKLLIKLKIVLYECESNCKYDLESVESKLKLDEYFNQKNFKMKSKQNILQEVILIFFDL